MNRNQFYIEQRREGDWAVRRGGAQRASGIENTQAEAIARAKQIDSQAAIHVERVRHTNNGSPDQWRKP